MKRVFILASLSIIIFTSFSAKAQLKSYIGLYGGVTDPLGNYASSDYNNNQSGFAKRSVTFGVDGAFYFHKNWAVGYDVSFQDQGKPTYDDTYNLAQGFTTAYKADFTTATASNRYHNFNILLGPQYSLEYGKFIVDLRASAGVIKVFSTPAISILLDGVPEQTATFYQNSASALLFGYGASAGLRYKLSNGFFLAFKTNYVSSQGVNISNTGQVYSRGRFVTHIPLSELQATIGFTIQF
jgi:hypothetical protein